MDLRNRRMGPFAAGVLLLIVAATSASATDTPRKDAMGREYFLLVPPRIDRTRTYWLAVCVHGYRGQGRDVLPWMKPWVRGGNCIVVCPSFPQADYVMLGKNSDTQLIELFETLQKEYPLHPKMFIAGFSGGSQFAHRFMMKYPDLVMGCAAHAGGTWASGGPHDPINPKAADIPLVISCGEKDDRIAGTRAFEKQIESKNFLFAVDYWPGVGHQLGQGVRKMTRECFEAAASCYPFRQIPAEIDKTAATAPKAALTSAKKLKKQIASAPVRTEIGKAVLKRGTTQLSDLIEKIGEEKSPSVP